MKERIYFCDNLKFILIILVVIGHFLVYSQDYQFSKALFIFIYSFHMPLFVFITGYLSKRLTNKDGSFRLNRVVSFFSIYFIFEMLVFIISRFILNQDVKFSFFDEGECPWYLLALGIWLMMTFLFQKIKPKYLLIFSVFVGLIVGYDDWVGTVLSLSRILVFYPFFLLGFYINKKQMLDIIDKTHSKKNIIFSTILLLIVFLIIYVFANNLEFLKPILTNKNPYSYFNLPYVFPLSALFTRLFVYIFALLLSILVISIVPKGKHFFTKFGTRTLAVYVLHFLIVLLYFGSPYSTLLAEKLGAYVQIIYIVCPIILSFVLSIKCFSTLFDKIISLKHKKIYVGGDNDER